MQPLIPDYDGAWVGALVPALSAVFAIPLLGEWPSKTDWVALVLISTGVYLSSGGPLPRWWTRTNAPSRAPADTAEPPDLQCRAESMTCKAVPVRRQEGRDDNHP